MYPSIRAISLAAHGWKKACTDDKALRKGTNVVNGKSRLQRCGVRGDYHIASGRGVALKAIKNYRLKITDYLICAENNKLENCRTFKLFFDSPNYYFVLVHIKSYSQLSQFNNYYLIFAR